MGLGDEILATGEARAAHERTGKLVGIYDRKGRLRWHSLWEGNPIIVQPVQGQEPPTHTAIINGSGARPYIDYDAMVSDFREKFGPHKPFTTKPRGHRPLPYRFTDHKCHRGEFHFVERRPPKYIVIEPHFKRANPNRDWGWDKWQEVVEKTSHLPWVQINRLGERRLRGVQHKHTAGFRDAVLRMASAYMYVGPEGGLYHAAAALGIRSVAIFGGFVSPANQGYDDCINIYEPEGSPCGERAACEHCRKIMKKIKPDMVVEKVLEMWNEVSSV